RLYQEALGDPELKRTDVELEAALANAREAREVVFDLFQDLEGFSLDDYKPFADVSTGLERLVGFLSSALADRNLRLSEVDEETIDLLTDEGTRRTRFTLNRDVATSADECDLLGLDHPDVQEELVRWRSLSPDSLGVALAGNGIGPAILSLWLVESTNGQGEKQTIIQSIAVGTDGARIPAIERQVDQVLRSPPATPAVSLNERLGMFTQLVEPSLQRELKHKGTASGDGSYSAELIGYVEIV
ncbi:MAG: helicase, partial [Pseudomonadota bacterium]